MNILLTGGAGYIGSHTAVELIGAGHHVIIADNLSNSSPEAVRRIGELTGTAPAFYEIDVCDRAALDQVFVQEKPEAVIHLAGLKAVGESVREPLRYYRNNLDAALTLLEVMAAYDVKIFVFSSSATVYGEPGVSLFTEDMPRGVCSSPYGRSKQMIEQFLEDSSAADPSLSVVMLRYFNPVGAHESGRIGEDPDGIPNNLMPYISQVAVGRLPRLTIFGNDWPTPDGTCLRDYLHVVDLARGHLTAVEYAVGRTGCEAINLGTGQGRSVLEMVNAFSSASGVEIPYVFGPRRPGDIAAYWADPSRAAKLLHWHAELTLEDMCRDSWNWQKDNPHGYSEE